MTPSQDTPLATIDDEVLVEYRLFRLQEADSDAYACEGLRHPEDPAWLLLAGEAGALLHSTANDHYAAVRLELWPKAQLHPDGWPEQADGEMLLHHPLVRLESTTARINPPALALSNSGAHHIRAFRRRTPRATEVDPEGSFAHDIEEWLLQIWPI